MQFNSKQISERISPPPLVLTSSASISKLAESFSLLAWDGTHLMSRVVNMQVQPGDSAELELIFRYRGSVPLEKMAALDGFISGVPEKHPEIWGGGGGP